MKVARMSRRLLLALLAALALTGLAVAGELEDLAGALGLRDVAGFARAVESVCRTGRLPERYLTKREARARGWRPGRDLCRVAPGRVIGGDRFGNREGLLPEKPGRVWYEADLDFACGRRGARRLVFSDDGLVFVTLDHYRSFRRVPCPEE